MAGTFLLFILYFLNALVSLIPAPLVNLSHRETRLLCQFEYYVLSPWKKVSIEVLLKQLNLVVVLSCNLLLPFCHSSYATVLRAS
jgi:hypothetical protein